MLDAAGDFSGAVLGSASNITIISDGVVETLDTILVSQGLTCNDEVHPIKSYDFINSSCITT